MVLRYRDFRIDILPARGEGFVARANAPDRLGEGRSSFIPPFGPQEEGLLARSLRRAADRHFEPEDGERPAWSLEEIGDRLSSALFQGEVLLLYQRSLDLLAHDPTLGLRLELRIDPRDPHVASLQDLPWELLRQPRTPEYLALSRRQPFVRYLTVPRIVRAAARPRPLRILAVAASPRGLPALDLARERRNLGEAVAKAGASIEIVDVEPPTLAKLREVLREQECHVLHFMGHGGSLDGREEKVLFFEKEGRHQHPVSGTDLLNKLADFPSLRLAVLNACDSAAVPDVDPFSGVASSLVLGGLPAVVAMRLPVSDPAAIAFSKALYRQIAAGEPVDAAVAEGRQAIHSEGLPGAEWATPVLFMRTPGGELFPTRDIVPASLRWKHLVSRAAAVVLILSLTAVGWVTFRHRQVEQLVTEGAAFYQHGQWREAYHRFQEAVKIAPQSPEVHSNLAATDEQLGFVPTAEKHYRVAVKLSPKSAEHLYNLGYFLNGQARYQEAYQVLKSAIRWDPKRVDAYGELASAALHLGLLEDARGALKSALRLDPERPALYRRLGEVELKAGRAGEALTSLNEALGREPLGARGRIETASLLVQAYDQSTDRAAACRQIDEFRRLDPAGATPWAPRVKETAARNGCPAER
jgi:Tfp pilus assembly protein PilF